MTHTWKCTGRELRWLLLSEAALKDARLLSSTSRKQYLWLCLNGTGEMNQLGLDLTPHDRKPQIIMILTHKDLFCQVEEVWRWAVQH